MGFSFAGSGRSGLDLEAFRIGDREIPVNEQAFMAVQMLVIELDNPHLEDQLDRIADTLNNDERYRPSQFAAMLAALAAPGPEAEDIDEQDE